MDTNDLEKLAQQAGLLTHRSGLLTFSKAEDFLPKLGRFLVLYREKQGTQAGIHKATLETKIAEFLDTENDTIKGETYMTDRQLSKNRLDAFVEWLYKDQIERERRFAEYLKLKAEFEPEQPKPAITWQVREDKVQVAMLASKPPVVGMVIPQDNGLWKARRFATDRTVTELEFDTLDAAKTWAVGHL